jgi:hypothetical protein
MGNILKSCLSCLEYYKDNITDEEKNKNNISIKIKNKINSFKEGNDMKERIENDEENQEINK